MLKSFQRLDKQAQEPEEQIMDATLHHPIDAKTNETFTATSLRSYKYRQHPSQEATNQILGSMWRSPQIRQIPAETGMGL